MFNYLVDFWNSVLAVFIQSSGNAVVFQYQKDYGTGTLINAWNLGINRAQLSRFLSMLSLVGLCIFLFYQIYKLIHAFIGGFYEDAL